MRQLSRAIAVAVALAAAPASAATFSVVASPGTPPIANAVTHNVPSSIYFDATNSQPNTNVTQIVFRLPKAYVPTNASAGAGWIVTLVQDPGSSTFYRVQFTSANCSLYGLKSGQTLRVRLDVTPPAGSIAGDVTDALIDVVPSDPCGNTSGWTTAQNNSITFQRKGLYLTGAVSPATGDSPSAVTVTWTAKNETTSTLTPALPVAPSVTTNPTGGVAQLQSCTTSAAGWTATGTAGDTITVTCGYTLTASPSGSTVFTFAASVKDTTNTVSAVGATTNQVTSGGATASFAFDISSASSGGTVRATLTVFNNKPVAITATPPGYSQLTAVQNLTPAPGVSDPAPVTIGPGAQAQFVYQLVVSGPPGATYAATAVASTSVGNTNPATTTPAGTISSYNVAWTPAAVVGKVGARPRPLSNGAFTITVQNPTSASVGEIDVINPQNNVWLGLADNGGSTLTAQAKVTSGSTDTLPYKGTLAAGATATLHVKFNAVPGVTAPTTYKFYVKIFPTNSQVGQQLGKLVVDTVPIGDVANVTLLSNGSGNTAYWTNTSAGSILHDGVVVLRSTPGTPPPFPDDGTDYDATPSAAVVYADKNGSTASSFADAATGAFDYRVCNHDSGFIYSDCATGFWNGAGWIDSVVPPTSGWAHNLGGAMLNLPGLTAGSQVGAASNVPSVNILSAGNGARALPAFALSRLPAGATPAGKFGNGKTMLIALDQGGYAVAIDFSSPTKVWDATYSGESFTAGASGFFLASNNATFDASYSSDVLFLPSTSGDVVCVNAWTGAKIWTVNVGAPIRGQIAVDRPHYRLVVATDGNGVVSLDLATSNGGGTPPSPATGWANPGGSYSVGCSVIASSSTTSNVLCGDRSGNVTIVDGGTGALVASGASGLSAPQSVLFGSGGQGAVISNASTAEVLAQSGTALTVAGSYSPGFTLSPVNVVYGTGTIYVGGGDRKLHKLSLANAADSGLSVSVAGQAPGSLLGPPVYDYTTDLIIFGSQDGHLWAVHAF